MKAVILAGGIGSRLRPLTDDRSKAMLPLAGKPVLLHIVEYLKKFGIDEIIITTNYQREEISSYFGDGSRFGVKIRCPREVEPLGTAGSVRNASKYLKEPFYVVQGDNITDIDLVKLANFHRAKNSLATLTLVDLSNKQEFGVANTDSDGKIMGFVEKPKDKKVSGLVNSGIYFLNPDVLDLIPRGKTFDFSRGLFPLLMVRKTRMYGFKARGFWIDIGTVDNYRRANRWILSRMKTQVISPSAKLNRSSIKGPIRIGDGAKIGSVQIHGPLVIGDNTVIGDYCTIRSGSSIGNGVTLHKKCFIDDSIIFESSRVGSGSSLVSTIVGESCQIGSEISCYRSVIGSSSRIGDKVDIKTGTIIWPNTVLET